MYFVYFDRAYLTSPLIKPSFPQKAINRPPQYPGQLYIRPLLILCIPIHLFQRYNLGISLIRLIVEVKSRPTISVYHLIDA